MGGREGEGHSTTWKARSICLFGWVGEGGRCLLRDLLQETVNFQKGIIELKLKRLIDWKSCS